MIIDGGVVLVTVDGEVITLSFSSGDTSAVGSLAIGIVQSGHVATRGNRLIVIGDLGTAIIDSKGIAVAELLGAAPTTSGIDDIAPRRSDCLIVQRALDGEVVVVRLDDGAIVAEALANAEVLAGIDGCEPVVPTSAGYLVIANGGVLRATIAGDVVALSPDGATVVAENSNRLELLPRVEQDNKAVDDEPIDIGRSGRTVFFAQV
jgi:hypothetical protein